MMRTSLCLLPLLLLMCSCASADLFLSTAGSDSSVTCGENDPCLTLRHAVDVFALDPSALLTLVLEEGTYSGPSNMNIKLPSTVATVIRAAIPGKSVKIDNTDQALTSDDTLFVVSNQLTLQDITLITNVTSSDAPKALLITVAIPELSIQNAVINGTIDTSVAAPESLRVYSSQLYNLMYVNSQYYEDIQIDQSTLAGLVNLRGQNLSITNSQFPDHYSLNLESNATTLYFVGNTVEASAEVAACSFEIADSFFQSAETGAGIALHFLMPEWCSAGETVVVRNVTIEDFGTGLSRYPDSRPFAFDLSDLNVSVRSRCIEIIIASSVSVTGSHFSDCSRVISAPGMQSLGGSHFTFDSLSFENCHFTNTGPIYFPSKSVLYPIPDHTLVQSCEFVNPRLPIADIQTWGSSASFINSTFGPPAPGSETNSSYLQVAANKLTIDGCTFDGQGADRIVQIDSKYKPKLAQISNSVFQNTHNCSVYVDDPDGREYRLLNCQFTGFDGAGLCYSSSYNDSSKPLVPMTVDTCKFSNAAGMGLMVEGAARISNCKFESVSRGITTNTSLDVVISDSSFTQINDVAIAAGADPIHPGQVKIDNLQFDHCTPWAIDCTNQEAILLNNPSSLCFSSGSAADNINTNTCDVRPAISNTPTDESTPKLPSWAIFLIVIAGLVVILLPVIMLLALFIVTVNRRRRRKDEFQFDIQEGYDYESEPY